MLLLTIGYLMALITPQVSSKCVDKVNDCYKHLEKCYTAGAWGEYMKKYCSKSCPGHCSSGGGSGGTGGTGGGNQGKCGRSSVQQSRIIDGVNAVRGAWPWIVSLNYRGRKSHFCGASLISPTWVLTASHCVDQKSPLQLEAILGEHDRRYQEGSEQHIKVKRIIMHPRFGTYGLQHDIALLQLEKPAQLNKYVQLACLPPRGHRPPVGSRCYLAGWGSVYYPGPSNDLLQQTVLPVVSGSHCTSMDGFICTGYGRKSKINACQGDSGGPYVCQERDGRWVQQGVTSFVVEYCKYYTAFTRISDYRDWINQYVKV